MIAPSSPSDARAAAPSDDKFRINAPQISLPKGGGAIRGVDEKFAANTVTGSGSMTVPIPTSPGRSSFGPQLSLSYDSTVVPETEPSGSGGSLRCRRSRDGPTRACRDTAMQKSRTSSSFPEPKNSFGSTERTLTDPGLLLIRDTSAMHKDPGSAMIRDASSCMRTTPAAIAFAAIVPALKGCLHASSDGRASTARTLTGDRSHPTMSRRSTAAHRTVGLLTRRTPPGFSAGRSVRATMIKATPSSTSTRRRMPIT
jgi:Salmonella virulence plasmid 65kDa B protein